MILQNLLTGPLDTVHSSYWHWGLYYLTLLLHLTLKKLLLASFELFHPYQAFPPPPSNKFLLLYQSDRVSGLLLWAPLEGHTRGPMPSAHCLLSGAHRAAQPQAAGPFPRTRVTGPAVVNPNLLFLESTEMEIALAGGLLQFPLIHVSF